jgi:hypothetical protein
VHGYVSFRSLPASLQPSYVRRLDDMTLLVVDPAAERSDVILWCREHLTPAERQYYREAFGITTAGLPDWVFDCNDIWIPNALLTVAERRRQDLDWELLVARVLT